MDCATFLLQYKISNDWVENFCDLQNFFVWQKTKSFHPLTSQSKEFSIRFTLSTLYRAELPFPPSGVVEVYILYAKCHRIICFEINYSKVKCNPPHSKTTLDCITVICSKFKKLSTWKLFSLDVFCIFPFSFSLILTFFLPSLARILRYLEPANFPSWPTLSFFFCSKRGGPENCLMEST